MKLIMLSLLTLLGMLPLQSYSADPDIYSHPTLGAIGGADVVAYYSLAKGAKAVKGENTITAKYQEATWHFSTEENRDLFVQDPERYMPQYGGYCAFAVSHNFTKAIDPDKWHIVEGKLYLNYNWIADRKWRKDKAAAIERGNNNWPAVLRACERHNNCR